MRSFTHSLVAAAVALAFAAGAQAQETMPPLVKQMFNGGWADKASIEQLTKDRLYYDAIEAYRLTLPALNTIGMRDGSEAKFGKGYNVLPIWKDRMNAKTWVPTPNCDVIYPYSDTCRTYSSITRVYGFVKNHFPSSQATGKPRLYVGKFGQHTQVTL